MTKKRTASAIAACLLILAWTAIGCNSQAHSLQLKLRAVPSPVKAGVQTDIYFSVLEGSKTITGAQMKLTFSTLQSPQQSAPLNLTAPTSFNGREYVAHAIFPSPGLWKAKVDIVRRLHQRESVDVEVQVD